MTKLFVKNFDCYKQYAQCKLFAECGNVALAVECKDVLKGYWNGLNSGLVDVEDIDLLYRKLCQCVRIITAAQAKAYDLARDNVFSSATV